MYSKFSIIYSTQYLVYNKSNELNDSNLLKWKVEAEIYQKESNSIWEFAEKNNRFSAMNLTNFIPSVYWFSILFIVSIIIQRIYVLKTNIDNLSNSMF